MAGAAWKRKKGFQSFPADSGDSALFLCKRKVVRCLEKKMGGKIDFEQIAIMGEGKSRLVPLDPYCNSKGNSVWT